MTVSSFFGHSKLKFWNCWMTSRQKDLYTKVFQDLGDQPSNIKPEQVDLIESFLLEVYYPNTATTNLNSERKGHYMRLADLNICYLPVSPF